MKQYDGFQVSAQPPAKRRPVKSGKKLTTVQRNEDDHGQETTNMFTREGS